MRKSFLFIASVPLLLSSLIACSSSHQDEYITSSSKHFEEYTVDISNEIQKNSLSESSIKNISKYKAIGVGVISDVSSQKRYKFIDKSNDDVDGDDFSYSLLGMTENNLIEELTFLTIDGNQLSSSSFNITYYAEIGDFIIFSYLPMSTETYVNNCKKWMKLNPDYQHWTDEEIEKNCQQNIIRPINHLSYPVVYSFKTKDGFLDTSFLIHKSSGKIFPFSSHRQYIDPFEIRGWLDNSVIDNQEETNLTVLDTLTNAPYFNYEINRNVVLPNYYFTNGLIAYRNEGDSINFYPSSYGFTTLRFDEQEQNLVVESYSTFFPSYNVQNWGSGKCDKWGNTIVRFDYDDTDYVYNVMNKSMKKINKDFINGPLYYDDAIRQFCFRPYDDSNVEKVVFLNQDFEKDYELVFGKDNHIRAHQFMEFLYKKCIDKEHNIFWTDVGIIKLNLDANGHYSSPNPFTTLSSPGVGLEAAAYAFGNYYFANGGTLYKVNVSNNYACEKFEDFPYQINYVYLDDYDNVTFEGVDLKSFEQVTGYITADDEVTFEINKNSTKITIFSPIN